MNSHPTEPNPPPGGDSGDDPLAAFAEIGRDVGSPGAVPAPAPEQPPIYRVSSRAEADADDDEVARPTGFYGTRSDPIFGFLIGMALSVGLTPILPLNADLRMVVAWAVLAGFGVLAWLVGSTDRIGEEAPEDLVWGVIFGVILALPLLFIGGDTLAVTVQRIFRSGIDGELRSLSPGVVLALLVFVMPLAETLFFRGLMQRDRPFWLVGALGSLWSIVLLFPMIEVARFPAIALIIGTALTLMNLIYSYVRQRNGLAAAWLCQIVINILVLFVPYVSV
jgi:hypothetical protein